MSGVRRCFLIEHGTDIATYCFLNLFLRHVCRYVLLLHYLALHVFFENLVPDAQVFDMLVIEDISRLKLLNLVMKTELADSVSN